MRDLIDGITAFEGSMNDDTDPVVPEGYIDWLLEQSQQLQSFMVDLSMAECSRLIAQLFQQPDGVMQRNDHWDGPRWIESHEDTFSYADREYCVLRHRQRVDTIFLHRCIVDIKSSNGVWHFERPFGTYHWLQLPIDGGEPEHCDRRHLLPVLRMRADLRRRMLQVEEALQRETLRQAVLRTIAARSRHLRTLLIWFLGHD